MQVFISYATEDRDLAEQVHFALVGAGHDTFFDKESLPPGGDFHSRIAAAVARSDAFVFLVGPNSVSAGSYALTELKHAKAKWRHPKGNVLPVLVGKVGWEQIPNYLKAVTVLEPEGNAAAEVVIAIAHLGEAAADAPSSSATGASHGLGVATSTPVNSQRPTAVAAATAPESIQEAPPHGTLRRIPVAVAVVAAAGFAAAGFFFDWGGRVGTYQEPRPDSAKSNPGPPPIVPVDKTPARGSVGAAGGNAWPASTAAWADFRCPLPNAKNPIASRAASLAPPDFSVDAARHLLLNKDGQAVSIAPATGLGPLGRRQFIVVHFSAGSSKGVEAYFQQPEALSSVHVMIARDGTVKQMVPFDFAAYHAGAGSWKGVSSLNRVSLGIDLENWGPLELRNRAWTSWSGHVVPAEEVLLVGEPPRPWQKYTELQLVSFVKVACALRQAYPSIEELVGHDQISPGRKTDPGPAFPMAEMQRLVFGAAGPRAASEPTR